MFSVEKVAKTAELFFVAWLVITLSPNTDGGTVFVDWTVDARHIEAGPVKHSKNHPFPVPPNGDGFLTPASSDSGEKPLHLRSSIIR